MTQLILNFSLNLYQKYFSTDSRNTIPFTYTNNIRMA